MRKYEVKSKAVISGDMFSVKMIPGNVWRLISQTETEAVMRRNNTEIKLTNAQFTALFRPYGKDNE